MRDIALRYPDEAEAEDWDYDVDIRNGEPLYVLQEGQTNDQRAAIAASLQRGTIPGNLVFGVDWGSFLTNKSNLVVIDNQVKQMISDLAGVGSVSSLTQYVPIYNQNNKGGVDVQVYRV